MYSRMGDETSELIRDCSNHIDQRQNWQVDVNLASEQDQRNWFLDQLVRTWSCKNQLIGSGTPPFNPPISSHNVGLLISHFIEWNIWVADRNFNKDVFKFNKTSITENELTSLETGAIAWFIHRHTIYDIPLSELTDGIVDDDDLVILVNAKQLPPETRRKGPHYQLIRDLCQLSEQEVQNLKAETSRRRALTPAALSRCLYFLDPRVSNLRQLKKFLTKYR